MALMEKIILIGGGGHAGSVADSVMQSRRYTIAGYIEEEQVRWGFRYLEQTMIWRLYLIPGSATLL